MNGLRQLRCPACDADFRGLTHCPRCGADLTRIMSTAAQAYGLRLRASKALRTGQYQQAGRFASEAQTLFYTDRGRILECTARLLGQVRVGA